MPGVDFERCYVSRIEVAVDGLSLYFIDLDNLKKNKRAVGRLQDLADLENLEWGNSYNIKFIAQVVVSEDNPPR